MSVRSEGKTTIKQQWLEHDDSGTNIRGEEVVEKIKLATADVST